MLITIDMKSDLAFIAINNSPYNIQEGSTKDNRHVIVSGISSITKLVKIVTLATTTGTSSQIPISMAVDLSVMTHKYRGSIVALFNK